MDVLTTSCSAWLNSLATGTGRVAVLHDLNQAWEEPLDHVVVSTAGVFAIDVDASRAKQTIGLARLQAVLLAARLDHIAVFGVNVHREPGGRAAIEKRILERGPYASLDVRTACEALERAFDVRGGVVAPLSAFSVAPPASR